MLKNYIDLPNADLQTPLHVAIRCGHLYLLPILIDLGSNLEKSCRYEKLMLTPIALAVAAGHTDCFDVLAEGIQLGKFHQPIHNIGNLLHLALQSKNPFMLRHLLSTHHDHIASLINRQDDPEGRTPLALACAMGYVEEIDFLISKGANPDIKDFQGRTAAHWAAQNRQMKHSRCSLIETLI